MAVLVQSNYARPALSMTPALQIASNVTLGNYLLVSISVSNAYTPTSIMNIGCICLE
jgi:hypothetical protein